MKFFPSTVLKYGIKYQHASYAHQRQHVALISSDFNLLILDTAITIFDTLQPDSTPLRCTTSYRRISQQTFFFAADSNENCKTLYQLKTLYFTQNINATSQLNFPNNNFASSSQSSTYKSLILQSVFAPSLSTPT